MNEIYRVNASRLTAHPLFDRPEAQRPFGECSMAAEDDVRRICLSLPETAEKPYARLPGFRVRNRLFAHIRENPYALVVGRPDIQEKEALIASAPDKFFQTPHYYGHPAVLVRLDAVDVEELEEILTEAWMLAAPVRLSAAFEAGDISIQVTG